MSAPVIPSDRGGEYKMVSSASIFEASRRVVSRVASRVLHSISAEDFCFAAGTHVATARGEIPVEQLRDGDLLRTRCGAFSPIVALSRHRLDAEWLRRSPELVPVTIRRNAITEGLPRRDLQVTAGQVFEPVHRNKLNHLFRHSQGAIAQRREDTLQEGIQYTVFRLATSSPVRAERIWVEATPAVRRLAEDVSDLPAAG